MTTKEYLQQIDDVITNGKYKDSWESLSNHKTPDWYYNGKLGIFIHWGIYSVPAYGSEWYSRAMYDKTAVSLNTIGKPMAINSVTRILSLCSRQKSLMQINGQHFFKESGAKFVMPVCEHHDGFAMYDTVFNRWNAKAMGPCRDITGEIKKACENNGLTFCASTHRAEHYFFMNMGRTFDSDVK